MTITDTLSTAWDMMTSLAMSPIIVGVLILIPLALAVEPTEGDADDRAPF